MAKAVSVRFGDGSSEWEKRELERRRERGLPGADYPDEIGAPVVVKGPIGVDIISRAVMKCGGSAPYIERKQFPWNVGVSTAGELPEKGKAFARFYPSLNLLLDTAEAGPSFAMDMARRLKAEAAGFAYALVSETWEAKGIETAIDAALTRLRDKAAGR